MMGDIKWIRALCWVLAVIIVGRTFYKNGDPTAKICLKLIEIKELVQKYHHVLVDSALV